MTQIDNNNTGYVVVTTLVFAGVFLLILYSLLGLVFTQYKSQKQAQVSAESLQIAEAGLDWYRWYLAHNPGDTDGPNDSMPYEKTITDPERGDIGTAELNVSGSEFCGQNQWIDITSTGWSKRRPETSRTVQARYTRPSVARYSFIINDNVWAGSDRDINGPYHANGGIRMDGTNNSKVTSAKSTWECGESFGCGSGGSAPIRSIVVGEFGENGTQLETSESVNAIGPKTADLSGNGLPDVPYVDSNSRIRLTDEENPPETLVTSSDLPSGSIASSKTRLWVGEWNGIDTSVYFVNENNDTLFRATEDGQVIEVAKPDDGVQAVAGKGDVDGDNSEELVFADASQQLRYVESNGKINNGQLGSNNGIGAGELAAFENIAGPDSAVAVDGSNDIKIVNEYEEVVVSTGDAAKSPPAVADVDNDDGQEVIYVSTSGILRYVDDVGVGNNVKTLRDNNNDAIDGSDTTGITSSTVGIESGDNSGTVTKPGIFGSSPNQSLWDFPVPPIDFTGITLDLNQIRSLAKSKGEHFSSTGGQSNKHGWKITFNGDNSFDVYRVQDTDSVTAYDSDQGWHENYSVVTKKKLQGTYTLSSQCPVVYAADKLWLEGEIGQKVTVAAAKTKNPNYQADIVISDNITYNNDDAGITAIAEGSVNIPLISPDNMKVNGIFVAQNGRYGRDHYASPDNSFYWWRWVDIGRRDYVKRDTLTAKGSIVSNGRVGTSWTDDDGNVISGFSDRENSFDRDLSVSPPPLTPFVSEEYELVRWQEVVQ